MIVEVEGNKLTIEFEMALEVMSLWSAISSGEAKFPSSKGVLEDVRKGLHGIILKEKETKC